MEDRRIYLIGPMGAGKTAVGRQLAKELGLGFIDADVEMEKRTGVDIPYIFEKEGEAGFRRREQVLIAELCELPDIVLSTGGGAILSDSTRQRLKSTGTVIYLHTTIDELLRRTAQSKNRPLLATGNRRETLEQLLSERGQLYEEIADIRVETTGRRVKTVAAMLKTEIERRAALQN